MHFTVCALNTRPQWIIWIDGVITELWHFFVRKCWLWPHQFGWIDVVNTWFLNWIIFLFLDFLSLWLEFSIFPHLIDKSHFYWVLFDSITNGVRNKLLTLLSQINRNVWSHNKRGFVFYMRKSTRTLSTYRVIISLYNLLNWSVAVYSMNGICVMSLIYIQFIR